MRKIFTKGLFSANLLIFSTVAFAGFGERKWDFAPSESVAIGAHYTISEIYRGAEYSCEAFKPQKVTFTLSYLSSFDLNNLRIVADDENKITHDQENKIFTLKDIKSLDISFPTSGNYIFTNITKERVIGEDCDAGDY